jgi:hypothetical protein
VIRFLMTEAQVNNCADVLRANQLGMLPTLRPSDRLARAKSRAVRKISLAHGAHVSELPATLGPARARFRAEGWYKVCSEA